VERGKRSFRPGDWMRNVAASLRKRNNPHEPARIWKTSRGWHALRNAFPRWVSSRPFPLRRIATRLAMAVAAAVFLYSVLQIVSYAVDSWESRSELEKTRRLYASAGGDDSDAIITAAAEQPEFVTPVVAASSPSEDEDRTTPSPIHWPDDPRHGLEVRTSFRELLALNDDVVGWLRIENTPVDYPVVQAEDNEFYLTRGFERQPNVNGSIFMDYRNGPGADRHLIVYGHNMKNGTMFTPLLKYESRYYFDAHPVIELNTLYEDTRWEIFSVHFTDIHHDYIRVDFAGDDDYLAFAQDLQSRSLHPTDIELRADDIILTLSTCTSISDESRFAVHARLIRE